MTPLEIAVTRLRHRRTKIVATLGPASSDRDTVEKLVRTGVNVFRLNFSHGTHESHRKTFGTVRDVAGGMGEPVAVLGDLCGPKIRAGRFEGGEIVLKEGSEVTVTVRDVVGRPGLIPSGYGGLSGDVEVDDRILLDDGSLELRVRGTEETEIRCTVLRGGVLTDRKGMNLPGVRISTPSLTDQDREDARFALDLGVDFLALSFVRRADDVSELRELVEGAGGDVGIIPKIEKPEALDEIDEILTRSDGIMVARGDLGVELPPESVPIAQSQLVDLAREAGKPVIVATQMLESMVESSRPTRAEVSDVSNAVRIGADAVMLSAETAVGSHPVRSVEVMDRVARETEAYQWTRGAFGSLGREGDGDPPVPVEAALARATAQLSRDLMVRAVVVFTRGGWTARRVSAGRPQAPVLAAVPEGGTWRRLALLWGVAPIRVGSDDLEDPHGLARRLAREAGFAEEGHHILEVRGFHHDPARSAPSLTVLRV